MAACRSRTRQVAQDAGGDVVAPGASVAEQAAAGIAVARAAGFDRGAEAILVHAGNVGAAPGKTDHGLVGEAAGLEVARGAQAPEHGLALDGALLPVLRLTRLVGRAVGVLLGLDAFALAPAQVARDVAVQLLSLARFELANERGDPFGELVEVVAVSHWWRAIRRPGGIGRR